MENSLPPAKKLRTHEGLGLPTLAGQDIDPTLKRKNQLSKNLTPEMRAMTENFQFKNENYRGALQELAQKQGGMMLNFETELKSGNPHDPVFICTCKFGNFCAKGEAGVKKWARQVAALAVLKKMGLVPKDYESSKMRVTKGSLPQKPQKPEIVVARKTKEDLLAERKVEEEGNIYKGTVVFYMLEKGYGFISADDVITVNGLTGKEKVYVAADDIEYYSKKVGLNVSSRVAFKVYTDSMGIGAYWVKNEDDTPIFLNTESPRDIQLKALKVTAPETILRPRKKSEMKPIIENKQYITGNFRGALQEYLVKMYPGVTLRFETELLQSVSQSVVYLATCTVTAEQNERLNKLVGTGHAAVKKSAIHFSALDIMLKLKILTEAEHFQVHQQWSSY